MDKIPQITNDIQQNGYAVLPGLLDAQWIERLKREEQRFTKQKVGPLGVQLQLADQSAAIREFIQQGPQLPIVIDVLGPDVCYTHQQFITKHPDEKQRTEIPWHQDNGFGRLEPPRDLTVWITLDDCDESNGCLWVLPGSHRLGLLTHHQKFGLMAADTETQGEGVALPLKAGDGVIFGGLLLHRSLANSTDKPRVAMYVRYCHPGVIMVSENNRPVLEDPRSWMVAGEAKFAD